MAYFQTDSFLSSVMGKSAFSVSKVPVELPETEAFLLEASEVLSGALTFASAKVEAEDIPVLRVFEKAGFSIVDVNMRFEKDVFESLTGDGECVVRQALKEDQEAVERLAVENLTKSRFNLDPSIDPAVAAEIKRTWAGNFFSGKRGDAMLVAEIDGTVVGFLLLLFSQRDLIIDLVAVDSSARRKGVASAMITNSLSLSKGDWARIIVGTQASNIGSMRFYQTLGFRSSGTQFVLHAHGE